MKKIFPVSNIFFNQKCKTLASTWKYLLWVWDQMKTFKKKSLMRELTWEKTNSRIWNKEMLRFQIQNFATNIEKIYDGNLATMNHVTAGATNHPGTLLSLSSQCNSFEDRVPVDEIYGYLIFKWVAVAELQWLGKYEMVPV